MHNQPQADTSPNSTLYLASPIVDGKPPIVPNSIEVATADEARRAVDEQKQRGADFIKVYSLLSRDAYFAIIDEARRQNIPVDGHVPNSVTVLEAAAAKQRTIEHSIGIELACSSREKDVRPKFLTANPFKNEGDDGSAKNLVELREQIRIIICYE